MGIFSRIMDKLRSGPLGGGSNRNEASAGQPGSGRVAQQQTQDMTNVQAGQQGGRGQTTMQNVDVEQVL